MSLLTASLATSVSSDEAIGIEAARIADLRTGVSEPTAEVTVGSKIEGRG
jgi:hypothetical protein